jgi:trk system potassium uptake protein TrkA
MKSYFAVFGLGTFGQIVAVSLSSAGHHVTAVDCDRTKIAAIKDKVAEALIADISNPDVIKELDVSKFDAIILGMSSHFEDAILTLSLLKEEKAQKIIAKANTSIQKRILLTLGAHEVIQPDYDMAERLSKKLSMSNISDMFEFKGSTIADVTVKEAMDGYSLKELDLRNKHNLTVLMIKKPGRDNETVWNPNTILNAGDELTVIGPEKDIIKVFKN